MATEVSRSSGETSHQDAAVEKSSKGYEINISQTLFPFKLYFFTFFMATFAVYPYKTLFYKQLGLSSSEAGLLIGIFPAMHLTFSPVLSYLADKLKKIKSLCLISTAAFAFIEFLMSQAPRSSKISINTNCSLEHNKSMEIQIYYLTDSEVNTDSEFIYSKTFIYLVLVDVIGGILSSASIVTATTLTLQNLDGKYERFGYQFLYSSVGYLISSLVVGSLLRFDKYLDTFCGNNTILSTDYSLSLYTATALYIVSFIIAFFFKEQNEPCDNNNDPLLSLYEGLNFQIANVLGACLFGGFAISLIRIFLFWHLNNLGGTQSLLILVTVWNAIGQILGNIASKYLIIKIGHIKVIYCSLIGFAVCFMTYFFIQDPWLVLLVECLDGISTGCLLVAATSYVGLIPGASTTAQSLVHINFHGLGPTLGLLLGGMFVSKLGSSLTFGIFSFISLAVLLQFALCNYIASRRNNCSNYSPLKNDDEEKYRD